MMVRLGVVANEPIVAISPVKNHAQTISRNVMARPQGLAAPEAGVSRAPECVRYGVGTEAGNDGQRCGTEPGQGARAMRCQRKTTTDR
jgi:hypothetical protein